MVFYISAASDHLPGAGLDGSMSRTRLTTPVGGTSRPEPAKKFSARKVSRRCWGNLAKKVFGSSNDRRLKSYRPKVAAINALEPEMVKLTDQELAARTVTFREQLAAGTSLDDLLVPAFATVREAAKRVFGQRHFDVQLIGGMVLHERGIAEMKTGEGKTLVATLAVYLNALEAKGVHVVTVNDYLARRDAEQMGRVYKFLGLTTGIIVHGLDDTQRAESYSADVTYGTNNEFGFDYLRGQHEVRVEPDDPARAQFRGGRRSGFDPDRRGADARLSSPGRPTTNPNSTTPSTK